MSQICNRLHLLLASLPRVRFPFDPKAIPPNGIYVLFEKGEVAHQVDRIVRIGTHTGERQLPSRLQQHFSKENKDKSIFRKNIGRAILTRNGDPFLTQWDLTTREGKKRYTGPVDQAKLRAVEQQVTDYVQRSSSFIVFRVDQREQRLLWESRLIGTVAACEECRPSDKWLGLHSPKRKIRQSGLWQVNELGGPPMAAEAYKELEAIVLAPASERSGANGRMMLPRQDLPG